MDLFEVILSQFNEELKSKNFVCENDFTLMDIAFYQEIKPVTLLVQSDKMQTSLIALKQWMERIASRECVKAIDDTYSKQLRAYSLVKSFVGLNIDTKYED